MAPKRPEHLLPVIAGEGGALGAFERDARIFIPRAGSGLPGVRPQVGDQALGELGIAATDVHQDLVEVIKTTSEEVKTNAEKTNPVQEQAANTLAPGVTSTISEQTNQLPKPGEHPMADFAPATV